MASNITHGAISTLWVEIARQRAKRGDMAGAKRAKRNAYGTRVGGAIGSVPMGAGKTEAWKTEAHARWQERVRALKAPA